LGIGTLQNFLIERFHHKDFLFSVLTKLASLQLLDVKERKEELTIKLRIDQGTILWRSGKFGFGLGLNRIKRRTTSQKSFRGKQKT
jgi:hypothetical protein